MIKSINLIGFVFIAFSVVFHSCNKEELPALSTISITNITSTSASSGGNITSDGGAGVTARGICWGLNANPATSDSKTTDGTGIGQFTSNLTGLTAGSTYHLRAYATNSVGTAYGDDMSFITLGQAATAITQAACCISSTGAKLNGTVNANYVSTTVTFEYGKTTNYGQTITAAQSPVTGNSDTNITAEITGLTEGTTYHFRIKTVNSLGTTYGDDIIFTTLYIPTLITTAVTGITSNSASSGGNISSDGGCLITARGVCWGTSDNPTIVDSHTTDGTGTGSFMSKITGLSDATTYNVRAYATNSVGTAYGDQRNFTTVQEDSSLEIIDAMSLGQKLSAPTPEPDKYYDDLIHPCVRYIPDGFAGHRWWMVASPYYNGNSSIENPILYYGDSREGELPPLSWTAAAIVEDTHTDGGYNSDPNIYFDGQKLWVLWRESWTVDCKENKVSRAVFGKSTSDGVTFSVKKYFAGEISGSVDHEMCPTIVDVNGKIRMYAAYHEFTPDRIPLGLSIWDIDNNDLDNNQFIKTNDVLPIYKTGFDFWHFDIFEYEKKYYCVVSPESGTEILLGQSDDGENFIFWSTPLISKEGTGKSYFYKPSAMVHQGIFYLWNPVAEIGISPMTTRIWMSEIKIDDLIKLLNDNEIKAVTN
jgi:hypothetical protein